MVERYVRDVEVAGSNPVTPIAEKLVNIRDCGFPQSLIFSVKNASIKNSVKNFLK